MLVWGLECDRAAQSIYLVDKVATQKLIYKSLAAFNQPTEPPIPDDLIQLLDGEIIPIETITLDDGRSFVEAWKEKRELILAGKARVSQSVEWTQLSKQTLKWYSQILKKRVNLDTLISQGIKVDWNNPTDAIRQILLDGRGEVTPSEVQQLTLLFGNNQEISRQIGRNILDLRVRLSSEVRWDKREELTDNLLEAMKKAVNFITQHNLIEGLSTDNLQTSTGSADCLAQICSRTGGDRGSIAERDNAIVMCQELHRKMLIDNESEMYRLKPHLQEFAREAT